MSRMHSGIPSKNTPLRSPPLTAQSPRRSPHCRVHNPSRRTTKIRWLRYNTNLNQPRPINQRTKLPLYYPGPLGRDHDWLHLHTPNRPKIANRLLISQPHRPCSRRNPHPNPMRIHRCTNPNNRPRTDIIRPILPSQH